MITHRINRRDAETITNSAVSSAAAALHHDVMFTAKIHDVPDDQKISWESELTDEREFFFELPFYRGADRGITLLRAEPNDRAQERIHIVTLRHGKRGKFVADVFERKREPLSQPRRVFNCFRQIPKQVAHFRLAL